MAFALFNSLLSSGGSAGGGGWLPITPKISETTGSMIMKFVPDVKSNGQTQNLVWESRDLKVQKRSNRLFIIIIYFLLINNDVRNLP